MSQTETTPPESDSNRPQLYKLIFDQNLDEVHLLIDFISGRSNRSLASLTVPGPQTSSDAMTSREIIQAIANMCFPPKGSDAVNAENAALLLLAKDVLSQLAEPATGLTIAYTAMFVDAEVKTCPNRIWNWTSDLFNSRRAQRRVTRSYLPDQRVDLAARAFPVLQDHAHRFRRWRDGLAWFSVGWLLLTAVAYWDAGLGRAALERLDQNWKVFTEDLKDDPTLVACDLKKDLTDSNVGQDAAHVELACRRFLYQRWKGEAAVKEVQSVFRCDEMSFALSKVVHVWCWKWLLTSYDPTSRHSKDQKSESQLASALSEGATKNRKEPSAEIKENPRHSNDQKGGSQQASALSEGATKNRKEPPQEIRDNATYWQTATSRLSVFTIYVLPMMFA